ncbi:MAG: hypothetical protein ACTSYD_07705 [Candidatus Heimdallarchaeaceae archaeon]
MGIQSSENEEHLWQKIIAKIQPYLTQQQLYELDADRFSALVKRLYEIHELSERELIYAKKNRDLILLRMGLLHAIPDVDKETLLIALKQIATHLVYKYYKENQVTSLEEAEERIIDLIKKGIASSLQITLNPEQELVKFRSKLGRYSKITLDNAEEIAAMLDETKEKLMEIGVGGTLLHEINKFCRELRSKNEENLPNKGDLVAASFEWQQKLKG